MTSPDRPYDDKGLTPEQAQQIDELIASHTANTNKQQTRAPIVEDSEITRQDSGFFGDCVTAVTNWDEKEYTRFDPETTECLARGAKELERRGIDVLLMGPEMLRERSQKNGGKLAEAFHIGVEAKVKPMPSLKIRQRTSFSFTGSYSG